MTNEFIFCVLGLVLGFVLGFLVNSLISKSKNIQIEIKQSKYKSDLDDFIRAGNKNVTIIHEMIDDDE